MSFDWLEYRFCDIAYALMMNEKLVKAFKALLKEEKFSSQGEIVAALHAVDEHFHHSAVD